MIDSPSLSSLLGYVSDRPSRAADLISSAKRQIAMNALSASPRAAEQLAFKHKTSMQNMKNYVTDHVHGAAGDALMARIISVEGLYAMSAQQEDSSLPDPMFALLGSHDLRWRDLPAGSLISQLF